MNLVVDRQGVIRYAGLHDRGLVQAVEKLPRNRPRGRSDAAPGRRRPRLDADREFPAITGTIGARDLQGEPAPTFVVEQWLTPEPRPGQGRGDRLLGDLVRPVHSIDPPLNQLADQFRDRVEFVGISNGARLQPRSVEAESHASGFRYSLTLDTRGRMMSAFGVRGIPHVAVISSDWVVQQQGTRRIPRTCWDRSSMQTAARRRERRRAAGSWSSAK